ncbi:MAG: TetR/AcrR family transcriptional regulator, partial [Myxococcota bacterium]
MGLIREPLQSRSRQVVEKLLEAAAHRFGQDGFERTSVRSIAADAGVPVGSVYQFFRDKEAVLETLTDRYVASVRGAFQA